LVVGVDVGKFQLAAVGRWADGRFERPWRVANPGQVRDFTSDPRHRVLEEAKE
jgi:hypothetical protein